MPAVCRHGRGVHCYPVVAVNLTTVTRSVSISGRVIVIVGGGEGGGGAVCDSVLCSAAEFSPIAG